MILTQIFIVIRCVESNPLYRGWCCSVSGAGWSPVTTWRQSNDQLPINIIVPLLVTRIVGVYKLQCSHLADVCNPGQSSVWFTKQRLLHVLDNQVTFSQIAGFGQTDSCHGNVCK
jgi:hypothetical protein